jgi:hypothetical protein
MVRAGLRKVPGQVEDNGRAIKFSLRHAMSDRRWYFTWSIGGRRERVWLVLGEKRGFASKCDVQPNRLTCYTAGLAIDLRLGAWISLTAKWKCLHV